MGNPFMTGFTQGVVPVVQEKAKEHRDNDRAMKDAQADVYWRTMHDPNATDQERQYATEQIQKIYGNSKPLKDLFQRFGKIFGHAQGASQPPQPTDTDPGMSQTPGNAPKNSNQTAGLTPPPSQAPTSGGGPAMSEQTPIGGSSTAPPGTAAAKMTPLGSFSDFQKSRQATATTKAMQDADIAEAAKHRATQADIAERKAEAKDIGLQEGTPAYNEFVLTNKFPTTYGKAPTAKLYKDTDGNPFMGTMTDDGMVMNNETGEVVHGAISANPGEFSPHQFSYSGDDGQPHLALRIGGKFVDGITKKPLPEGTTVFSAWMQQQNTETTSFKTVKMKDGSETLVPVTTESTRTRGKGPKGGLAAPPKQSDTAPSAAPTTAPTKKSGARVGTPIEIPGAGTPPTEVKKAFDAYNGSQTRYNIMSKALPLALKGDQQAMINLLYNHIGMTTGLQKGARITQDVIDEAQHSAPFVATLLAKWGVGTEFGPQLLRGVTLTPQQMQQMIGLAKDRLQEDYSAYQRELKASKAGYGTNGEVPPPSGPGLNPPPGGAKPKTAADLAKSLNITGP